MIPVGEEDIVSISTVILGRHIILTIQVGDGTHTVPMEVGALTITTIHILIRVVATLLITIMVSIQIGAIHTIHIIIHFLTQPTIEGTKLVGLIIR